jgi:hypothetical protein
MSRYRALLRKNPFRQERPERDAKTVGMATIDDATMRRRLSETKTYALVVFRKGRNWQAADAKEIVWEHGRRNFELRESKKLAIVCPLAGDSEIRGIALFDAALDETVAVMNEDPAVKAGVLSFDAYLCSGFPGDALP